MMEMNSVSPKGLWVENLLDWYQTARRPLPWRRNKDPYAILGSGILTVLCGLIRPRQRLPQRRKRTF